MTGSCYRFDHFTIINTKWIFKSCRLPIKDIWTKHLEVSPPNIVTSSSGHTLSVYVYLSPNKGI